MTRESGIRTRPLATEDIDVASDFLRQMMSEMAEFGGDPTQAPDQVSGWFKDRIRATANDPNHVFLVALSDRPTGTLKGILDASAATRESPLVRNTSLHIHAIYVPPRDRRKGVATHLFEAAFEWARSRGCLDATLHVLEASPARSLYEELGFRRVQVEMRRKLWPRIWLTSRRIGPGTLPRTRRSDAPGRVWRDCWILRMGRGQVVERPRPIPVGSVMLRIDSAKETRE